MAGYVARGTTRGSGVADGIGRHRDELPRDACVYGGMGGAQSADSDGGDGGRCGGGASHSENAYAGVAWLGGGGVFRVGITSAGVNHGRCSSVTEVQKTRIRIW